MAKKKNPLAEAPAPVQERTTDIIAKEYQQLCTQAGDVQYKIVALQNDLDNLNVQMLKLNQEHFKLQQEERAKAEQATKEAEKAAE